MEFRQALLETEHLEFLILGGGSNILLTGNYPGLVIKNSIKGMEILDENENHVILKSYSGEIWHELVMHCVGKGWGGIENLSLIPGTVGAAPMQNIGAYGVELERVFLSLEALNLNTLEMESFDNAQCAFHYRESVFKNKLKGKFFIYSVTLKLDKHPVIQADYGDIKQILTEKGLKPDKASIREISDAVIQIRQSKLPDPKELGNSGSFFKNPVIEKSVFEALKIKFPDLRGFEQVNGVKIPAAWLIEQCGWKGRRIGNTGSHARQALVLVNYGEATGREIWNLALEMITSIKDKFGIVMEPEVNVIG